MMKKLTWTGASAVLLMLLTVAPAPRLGRRRAGRGAGNRAQSGPFEARHTR
ncbi:MAG: hypothetical protein R6V57_10525 [Vicinamibacterales bacterium]